MQFVIYQPMVSICEQQSPVAISYLPKFQAGFTEESKQTLCLLKVLRLAPLTFWRDQTITYNESILMLL